MISKKNIALGALLIFGLVAFLNKDVFINTLNHLGNNRYSKDTLNIALSTPSTNLSSDSLNLNNLTRTANIYEALVIFDPSLRIRPSLAASWGNLEKNTWEFKLRQGVVFHDKTPFNADSVIKSFEHARLKGSSQVKSIIQNIERIDKLDNYTIQIITKSPDPLILSKLTKLYISEPESLNGTGPYRLADNQDDQLILEGFPDYWGELPAYEKVIYSVIKDKALREQAFEKGDVDLLVAVPRDQALSLPPEQVRSRYSLEVNFLMFKLDDPLLQERRIREAIQTIFDPKEIEKIGNNFVRQSSQFVAPGVYGFNSEIEPYLFSEEKRAKSIFGEKRERINLDFLSTYRTLAQYLTKQLNDAGFLVEANAIEPQELLDRVKNNRSQLFVIGWQAENGDAGDFLDAFIHSEGEFNGGRYENKVVDQLIEESRQELDRTKRLALLKEIMAIVHNDLIGIPLFESSRLYAVQKNIEWEPRLDGLVLAKEVR